MCLSTAVLNSAGEQHLIMKEVAGIEAEGRGFWLVNLFGERKFVEASLQHIDFVDDHIIIFENKK